MNQYKRNDKLLRAIAGKLKKLRQEKNLSQADVYIDMDLNMARVEGGNTSITLTTLYNLCQYYETDLSEFFKDLKID